MPAHTLYDLAKQQLIRNISILDDIGDIPYSFLAPVLRHIQNPQQLIELEARCPQLPGETGEIWQRFIKRDIPNWDSRSYQPKDPKNWSRAYKKLLRDAEREKFEQEEALKESMRALQKSREGNKTLIVEGKTGYDPANRRWGYGSRGTGTGVWKGGGSWGDPAAPRKTGKIVLDKLRRGVFDHKMARPKATMMPAHILAERRGVVKSVPERLVRMTQNEGPKNEATPKPASVPVVERSGFPNPTLRKPITSRAVPQPQQGSSSANKATSDKSAQRPSLPAGQHFTAPKLQASSSDAPRPVKRRKEGAPSVFHPSKKRKA